MSLLVVQHVPWEGPHRIAAAFDGGLPLSVVRPLDGEPLPPPGDVAGAVLMGGPMNVDEVERYAALDDERRWVEQALELGLPLLGVCLGSQLIARALGAEVVPGPESEIGWLPVTIEDVDDPVTGPLAPATTVLHWHGDRFQTPPGARSLASSEATPCQAFRFENARGLLFHPEADAGLVRRWLAEPSMASEARHVLGSHAAIELREGAEHHGPELIDRSTRSFAAFAALVSERS